MKNIKNKALTGLLALGLGAGLISSYGCSSVYIPGIKVGEKQVTETGRLKVESSPEGAKVYINNEYVGETPLTYSFNYNKDVNILHSNINFPAVNVRLEKEGYSSESRALEEKDCMILNRSGLGYHIELDSCSMKFFWGNVVNEYKGDNVYDRQSLETKKVELQKRIYTRQLMLDNAHPNADTGSLREKIKQLRRELAEVEKQLQTLERLEVQKTQENKQ